MPRVRIALVSLFLVSTAFAETGHELPENFPRPDAQYKEYSERWGKVQVFSEAPKSVCHDFGEAACTKDEPKDSTGRVVPFRVSGLDKTAYEKQNQALAAILKRWNDKSNAPASGLSDYLVTEYIKDQGIDKKLARAEAMLKQVKASVLEYVEGLGTVSRLGRELLKDRLESVKIRTDYRDKPGELFSSGANVSYSKGIITFGGNYLLNTTSSHNLFFVLAHEVQHFLDTSWGEAEPPMMKLEPFDGVRDCLAKAFAKETIRGTDPPKQVNMREIEADWLGQQLYPSFLASQKGIDDEEKLGGMKNVMRFMCGNRNGSPQTGHPSITFRASFLLGHPDLAAIACRNTPNPPVRPYCPARRRMGT